MSWFNTVNQSAIFINYVETYSRPVHTHAYPLFLDARWHDLKQKKNARTKILSI